MFPRDDGSALQNFWNEVTDSSDSLVFSLRNNFGGVISVIRGEEEAGIFWSSFEGADNWNTDPDCVVVALPLSVWREQIVPSMVYENVLIGLNWNVLKTNTVIDRDSIESWFRFN